MHSHRCHPSLDISFNRNVTILFKEKRIKSGSVNKIKISQRGLPKDFFSGSSRFDNKDNIMKRRKTKTLCSISNQDQQLRQTPSFQLQNRSALQKTERQVRDYKSQERRKVSKQKIHTQQTVADEYSLLNCTFSKQMYTEQLKRSAKQQNPYRIRSDHIAKKSQMTKNKIRVQNKNNDTLEWYEFPQEKHELNSFLNHRIGESNQIGFFKTIAKSRKTPYPPSIMRPISKYK